jgi:hypothetical protein
MHNLDMKIAGSILTIVIDLNKTQGASKSGKSQIIATTGGNLKIPGSTNGAVLGLNVYRPL